MGRADSRDLIEAAFVASFAAPVVVTLVFLVGALISRHGAMGVSGPIGALIFAFYLAGFVALPVSWLMTLCLGVPVILAWRHWRGRVGAVAATCVGLTLGATPIVIATARDGFRSSPLALVLPALLFGACGVAVALTFWFLALRDE